MESRTQPGTRAAMGTRGLNEPKSASEAPLQPTMDEVTQNAAGLASDAKSAATSLGGDIKDAAKTMGEAVKQQAGEFAAGVGRELSETAERQKARGVETIQSFARAITSAAGELDAQSPRVAQSVRDAARKVENLSANLNDRNVDELVKAATDLARSQPLLFIGGAVAAGFAFARFVKSSAAHQAADSSRGPAAE